MKRPLSIIVITKDPKTMQEVHTRYDAQTGFPRFRLVLWFVRAFFSL
jgi:hypothetical protein